MAYDDINTRLTESVTYKKGETIVYKGKQDTGIYYIKSGIAVNVESGIKYGRHEDGCEHQFFGLIGSLNMERTSTIVAETDVELLKIDFSIIGDDESVHTIIHELMQECVEIIINLEKRIKDLERENRTLENK